MDGTDFFTPQVIPTICGPVSDFQKLTTVDNAYSLGELGFVMGILVPILFYIGYIHVAPRIFRAGTDRGWW